MQAKLLLGKTPFYCHGNIYADILFRGNADDGLLCGVLLLPMVAAAKLIDATNRSLDPHYIGKQKKI